jgi:RNA polymerase sigma-70 factor, ECF subfamily
VPSVPQPEPDDLLVRRFLDGDPSAFTTLVQRHETRVYNLCLRMLGNPEDALDAAQETFVTALRKLGQFRGDAAFTTWLHRVAVNACYDEMRRQRRRPMLHSIPHDDGDGDRAPEPGPPVRDHAEAVAGALDAGAALAQVPEDFRTALVLADVQDLPYEEIARILDVPVGTVKSRVHRGRVALARAMGLAGEPERRSATSKKES